MTTAELEVDSLAAGGDGVGRQADGRVVFVARSAPGDRVRADLFDERARFARGELREVVRPGPDRVEPPCEYFRSGACGGCQWQHLAPAAQARAKQDIAAAALRHCIAAGLELRPLIGPAPPYGWRRRARLHWRRPADGGRAHIGYFERRSHRIVDIERCPQLEAPLEAALGALRAALAPAVRGEGEIQLVVGHRGDIQVSLFGDVPRAAAAGLVGQAGIAGVTLGRSQFGAPTIEIEPGLRGRADHFAQASRAGNAALIAQVDAATAPRAGRRLLELYAGSGNLTRVLRKGAAGVVAVDVGRAPRDLAGVSWRRGPAAAVAAALAAAGEHFDTIVLDPPRTGAADVLPAIIALAPERVVYVSCDPATFARDLTTLSSGGYRPVWAQPLDLMPQTAHLELVGVISAAESS